MHSLARGFMSFSEGKWRQHVYPHPNAERYRTISPPSTHPCAWSVYKTVWRFEEWEHDFFITTCKVDSVMFSLNSLTCRLIHSRVLQVSTTACNLLSSRRGDPSNMRRYSQKMLLLFGSAYKCKQKFPVFKFKKTKRKIWWTHLNRD